MNGYWLSGNQISRIKLKIEFFLVETVLVLLLDCIT